MVTNFIAFQSCAAGANRKSGSEGNSGQQLAIDGQRSAVSGRRSATCTMAVIYLPQYLNAEKLKADG
ncbi:MAG: hypothetical protein KME42_18115 [Tildeniella nuda ZEHNDER 1965/U140]|nr:hypothetical protein [Tildeniella nuda ZEHNDER 1965/U140]